MKAQTKEIMRLVEALVSAERAAVQYEDEDGFDPKGVDNARAALVAAIDAAIAASKEKQ